MQTLITQTHPQWQPLLQQALKKMDEDYLLKLKQTQDYLPAFKNIFAAFNQPLDSTQYILLGESPYPRVASANGYAFWDAAVNLLWSEKGLSKQVNRATSLRNLMKTLLVARGDLDQDRSQEAIADLDKSDYCQTAEDFFTNMHKKGFLLLNASLIYAPKQVNLHAKHWQPFISSIFEQLSTMKPDITLLLFGRIAAKIPEKTFFTCLIAEHPYNLSFIDNKEVLAFFKPLDLLKKS